jgi:hypothetical protein
VDICLSKKDPISKITRRKKARGVARNTFLSSFQTPEPPKRMKRERHYL